MLGKLLKYDMKEYGRILLPLYAVLLFLAFLLGISTAPAAIINIGGLEMAVFLSMVFTAVIIGALLVTLILVIESFYKNLLGDRGYLMFSLPVRTETLVGSKILSGVIWSVLSGAAAILACAIAVGIIHVKGGVSMNEFQWDMNGMSGMFGGRSLLSLSIQGILIALTGIAETTTRIFAAIAIGHLWSRHRAAGAFIAYIALTAAQSVVKYILVRMGLHVGNSEIFRTSFEQSQNLMGWFWPTLILSLIWIAVFYVITSQILSRKLNLQ